MECAVLSLRCLLGSSVLDMSLHDTVIYQKEMWDVTLAKNNFNYNSAAMLNCYQFLSLKKQRIAGASCSTPNITLKRI